MPKRVVCRDLGGNKYPVVATDLAWRPAAYAIVVRNNRVLLTKQLGGYHLPGGGVNLGELPDATVVRETKEETGADVRVMFLADLLTSFFSYTDDHSNLQHVQALMAFYACEYLGGDLSTDGFDAWEREVAELAEWVPISDLGKIKVGSTYDWRPVVHLAIKRSRG